MIGLLTGVKTPKLCIRFECLSNSLLFKNNMLCLRRRFNNSYFNVMYVTKTLKQRFQNILFCSINQACMYVWMYCMGQYHYDLKVNKTKKDSL